MSARMIRPTPALVLLLGFACIVILQWSGLDLRLADALYTLQDHAWRLRHDAILADVLHGDVQRLTLTTYLLSLLLGLVACVWSPLRALRRQLIYVALASTACYVVITLGKEILPVPCPWDLRRYGGHLPPGGWLQWQAGAQRVKGCFPAGHAAGGYMLFAWFFAARDTLWPHAAWLRIAALGAGLGLGLVQQVRGAHFLSHDVATATLCWVLCDALATLAFARRAASRTTAS